MNILELVTFYPMLRQKVAGKTHIRVCRTLSCAMAGSYRVMENVRAAAGIAREHNGAHQPVLVSSDANFSVEFVECLASCGNAPVCMVNNDLHENVDPESVGRLLTPGDAINGSGPEGAGPGQTSSHPLEHRLVFKNIGRKDWTPDIDCY